MSEKMVVGGIEYAFRTELEGEIAIQQRDPASKNIQTLIDLMINDIRAENDTAMIRKVIRNQGKIASLQQLKDIITRDLTILQKKA